MFSDDLLLYFLSFSLNAMLRDHFLFYFSFLATNSLFNIFKKSEKPGGRARFSSEIPGGRAILLGRPRGSEKSGLETSKNLWTTCVSARKDGYFTRDDFSMAAILFSISFHFNELLMVV